MPGMNAVGMNTAAMTRAIATTGPDTSSIAFSAASRGERPRSMCCSTTSTTTMASSTTRRSEEHTSELQSHSDLVCRLLLEKKKMHAPLLTTREQILQDTLDRATQRSTRRED